MRKLNIYKLTVCVAFFFMGLNSWAKTCISKEKFDDRCFGYQLEIDSNLSSERHVRQLFVSSQSCAVWPPFFREEYGKVVTTQTGSLKFYNNNNEEIGELYPSKVDDGLYFGQISQYEFVDCEIN